MLHILYLVLKPKINFVCEGNFSNRQKYYSL